MKTVNKSFLEEEVRKVLKEYTIHMPPQPGTPEGDVYWDFEQQRGATMIAAAKALPGLLRDLAIGSMDSYKVLQKQLKATGLYGMGIESHYLEAMQLMQGINKEPVPYSLMMLRFYETLPVEGDQEFNPKTLNLKAREDIAKDIADVKAWGYKTILPILARSRGAKSKAQKLKLIKEIEKALITMSYDNNLSFEIAGGLDESIKDIADTYGIRQTKGIYDLRKAWGSGLKDIKKRKLFKNSSELESVGYYNKWAKIIFKSGRRTKPLEINLEKFIMGHFVGMSNRRFSEAMRLMTSKANLRQVAQAHLRFQVAQSRAMRAFVGILDIGTALPTTAALIISMLAAPATGGTSVAMGGGVIITRKAAISGLRAFLMGGAKNARKIAATAEKLRSSTKLGKTIQALDSLKAQALPIAVLLTDAAMTEISNFWNDLERNNNVFIRNYKTKSKAERIAFYREEIKPALSHLAFKHAQLLDAAGTSDEQKVKVYEVMGIRVQKIKNNLTEQMYRDYNVKAIQDLQRRMDNVTQNLNLTHLESRKLLRQLQGAEKKQKEFEKGFASSEKGLPGDPGASVQIPVATAFSRGMPAVKGLAAATDPTPSENMERAPILEQVKKKFQRSDQTKKQVMISIKK